MQLPAHAPKSTGEGRILVVDDDPEIREAIQWFLEDGGFSVETAADGQEAVNRALQSRPALIVLDLGLPLLNGEQVADAVRAAYDPPPPIVVVTAGGSVAARAARCGAVAYLAKPFDLAKLAELVLRHMEHPQPLPLAAETE
jgi:DNA-binding response OmpR family regulator